jgi:hypothetical protein
MQELPERPKSTRRRGQQQATSETGNQLAKH